MFRAGQFVFIKLSLEYCTIYYNVLLEYNITCNSIKNKYVEVFFYVIEQSDIQAEMERMRLELQNTIAMYNQTCEHLIHAQNKVKSLSIYFTSKSGT